MPWSKTASPKRAGQIRVLLAGLAVCMLVAAGFEGRPGDPLRVSAAEAFQPGTPRILQLAMRKAPQVDEDAHPFTSKQKAPSLDGGVEWINTAGPIDLAKLRGKFVLLDFWTYCCINCMHILPELKKLEHAYPNEIVVIGVHSAKFAGEQDSKNIREAVERYEIEHPVVNDAEHVIWDKFAVQSWPTLRVIDPEGNVVAAHSGEIDFDSLDQFFKDKMAYYKQQGLTQAEPAAPHRQKRRPDACRHAPAVPWQDPGG